MHSGLQSCPNLKEFGCSRVGVWIPFLLLYLTACIGIHAADVPPLRVGTGRVVLEAKDANVLAGTVLPRKVSGQEGELRVVATVLEMEPSVFLSDPMEIVDGILHKFPRYSGQRNILLYSDILATVLDPDPEILAKYQASIPKDDTDEEVLQ